MPPLFLWAFALLVMLNGNHMLNKLYHKESRMVICMKRQYSAISEHSTVKGTPKVIKTWLTSLPEDSHVSRFPQQVYVKLKTMSEICGPQQKKPFGLYSHNFSSLKMSATCSLFPTSNTFSDPWPKSGIMQNGKCYQQKILVPSLDGTEYGFLLRKSYLPSGISAASGFRTGSGVHPTRVRLTKIYGKKIANILCNTPHKTNPRIFEFMMGWPIGWTSLLPLKNIVIPEWTHDNFMQFKPLRKVKYQEERIRCIGNGQVPLCVSAMLGALLNDK